MLCFNHGGDELDQTDVGMGGKVLQVSDQNPQAVLITMITAELWRRSTPQTHNVINMLLLFDVKPAGVTVVVVACWIACCDMFPSQEER